MTIDISNNAARVNYTVASGVTQTSFSVPFEFFNDSDLSVYVDDVLKTITTNYTVSGGDGSTGTITMSVTGASGGSKVVISRSIAIERTSDFQTGVDINRAALNTQLDTLTAIAADNQDKANRSITAPNSEVNPVLELPDADTRKGKLIGFNETTGNVELSATLADGNTLASISSDIATLADIEDGTDATDAIQTVAGVSSNVTTVAGSIASVNTNATNIASINTNASNIADIQNASANAASALASKNSATASAATATTQATNSSNSATASETSKVASVAAQAAAETAKTAAETAETNAETAQTAAETAETNAAASETAAATSETNASTSAATATTQAGIATTKAGEAATSATASATSASASEAAKDAALAALDSFDDRYLGAKASDPTLDNDGNALVSGALYFNTTDDVMKVYEGSTWVAAYASLSGALLVANNLSDLASASSGRTNLGLGTAATTASTDYATAAQGTLAASATQPGDLATVATSGAYGDLSGTPTLGTAASSAATDFVAVTGDTMTGNLDVQGTVTADGLTVETTANTVATFYDDNNGTIKVGNNTAVTGNTASLYLNHNSLDGVRITSEAKESFVDAGSRTADLAISTRHNGNLYKRMDIASYGDISFYEDTGTTPKFFWDASAESLGIGTSSPTRQLDVSKAGTAYIRASDTSSSVNMEMLAASSGGWVGTQSNHSLNFQTNNSERMRIDSSGNVGIGVIPVSSWDTFTALQIEGSSLGALGDNNTILGSNIYHDNNAFKYIGTAAATVYQQRLGEHRWSGAASGTAGNTANMTQHMTLDSSGNLLVGTTSGSDKVTVNGTVSATNFNTTSDATLKTNVETLTGSLDAVKSLRGVSFDWLENGNSEVGVIAQEVEAVLPDVVSTNDQGIKSVKYGNMVALLIEAMKEQQAQIDELKAKLGE